MRFDRGKKKQQRTNRPVILPAQPEFREALTSFELIESSDEGELIIPESGGINEKGVPIAFPSVSLKSNLNGEIGYNAITRALTRHFAKSQHPSTKASVDAALATYVHLKSHVKCPLEFFNELFGELTSVDVSHFVIAFSPPTEVPDYLDVFGYKVGPLNTDRFAYRCQKCNSDYFERYGSTLKGRVTIESPIFNRCVVPFMKHYWNRAKKLPQSQSWNDRWNRLLLSYYESIARVYMDSMFRALDERQTIVSAAGLGLIDVESWKSSPGTSRISVFQNQADERWDGYVVPDQVGIMVNSWPKETPILYENAMKLCTDYRLSELKHTDILETLKTFSRFGAESEKQESKGRISDAFLSLMIGLELVFNERDAAARSVTRRVAIVASNGNMEQYEACLRRLKTLYELRSKFVHAGRPISDEALADMKQFYRKTLHCLLRLNVLRMDNRGLGPSEWLKKIDWLSSGLEAGEECSPDALKQAALNAQSAAGK